MASQIASPLSFNVDLYTSTIPTFLQYLQTLSAILTKASNYAADNNIPESYILSHRLFPDMQPFAPQIQRISDTARGVAYRVFDIPKTPIKDDEKTFEDLQARISKTIEELKTVKKTLSEHDGGAVNGEAAAEGAGEGGKAGGGLHGRDAKSVEIYFARKDYTWKTEASAYVTRYAVPNFFFHVSIAYAILRSCGVPLGKSDFLGVEV